MTHRSQTALYLSLVAAFSLLHTTQGIISLDVSPDSIQSGNSICPNTQVVFNCSANIVSVVQWKRNDTDIRTFTLRETAPIEEQVGAFTVVLNESVILSGDATFNATSSLIADLSDFQSRDRIQCLDLGGKSIELNFTYLGIPSKPLYDTSIGRGEGATLNIIWNDQFNSQNDVEVYEIAVSGHQSINCPSTCLPNETCVCSGLFAGRNVTSDINITAVNCGNQEGLPATISITPRIPDMPSSCWILPDYQPSGTLIGLDILWNKVSNPLYLISGRPQNVENYTLSIDRSNIDIPVDTACRMGGQNYTCSYSRTSNSSTDVSVAAVNIIGSGPSRTCSANRNISVNNDVFSVNVMADDGTVQFGCTSQLSEDSDDFLCQFCYGVTCENYTQCVNYSTITTRQLNNIANGEYCYRTTGFLNGEPIAIISSSFLVEPESTMAYPWVTPLWVISVIFIILDVILLAIDIVMLIYWSLKSKRSNEKLTDSCKCCINVASLICIADILMLSLSIILLIVYSSNTNGTAERNSVAASFFFSLVSLFLSIIALVVVYYQPLKYFCNSSDSTSLERPESPKYPEDPEDPEMVNRFRKKET